MSLFKKKTEEKQSSKEMREIVLDMLIKGEEKQEILKNLEELGLKKQEAEGTLKKAEQGYEDFIKSRLTIETRKAFQENKEELMERIDAKIDKVKKEIKIKRDLQLSSQRDYIDKEIKELRNKIEALERQFFDLRAEVKK